MSATTGLGVVEGERVNEMTPAEYIGEYMSRVTGASGPVDERRLRNLRARVTFPDERQLAAIVRHGPKAADKALSSSKLAFVCGEDFLSGTVGKYHDEQLMTLGFERHWLSSILVLTVWKATPDTCVLATWDNVFNWAIPRVCTPDIASRVLRWREELKRDGSKMLQEASAAGLDSSPLYLSDYITSPDTALNARRFLASNVLYLTRLFSGDGYTTDAKGVKGFKEYLTPSVPVSSLCEVAVLPLAPLILSKTPQVVLEPSPMSIHITSLADIAALTHPEATINTVPVSEVERRCLALEDRTQDPRTCRARSWIGFLAPGEKLSSCLHADYVFCASVLRNTHRGLSSCLRRLLREAEAVRASQSKGVMADIELTFTASEISHTAKPQNLQLIHRMYAGDQLPPYYSGSDGGTSTPHTSPSSVASLESDVNCGWSDEYVIKSITLPPLEILVAGNWRCGSVSMIERYGFYQGGSGTNPYRIDPALLFSVLTGQISHYAVSAAKKHAFAMQRYNEIHGVTADLDKVTHALDSLL
ncbi:hypothetical protein Pelo_375 [Pelomyxa schiedti]|nr:hypothetical protein Pelo_375 [Pelomyxa schiedti]